MFDASKILTRFLQGSSGQKTSGQSILHMKTQGENERRMRGEAGKILFVVFIFSIFYDYLLFIFL